MGRIGDHARLCGCLVGLCLGGVAGAAEPPADEAWRVLDGKLAAVAAGLAPPPTARRMFFDARLTIDADGGLTQLDLVDPALAPLEQDWLQALRRQAPFPRLPADSPVLLVSAQVEEHRLVPGSIEVEALDGGAAADLPLLRTVLGLALAKVGACSRGPAAAGTQPRVTALRGVVLRLAPGGEVQGLEGLPTSAPAAACAATALAALHAPPAPEARRLGLSFSLESGPPRLRLAVADPAQRLPAVERALQLAEPGLWRCFDLAAAGDPSLAGRMTFELVIDPAGSVALASVTGSTVRSDALGPCALTVFGQLTLPPAAAPGAPAIAVEHPVLFKLEELAGAEGARAGWATARSRHFVLFTDGGAGVARRALEEAERAHQGIQQAMAVHFDAVPELGGVQTIVVISSDGTYTMVAPENSGGLFRPGRTWGDEDFILLRGVGRFDVLKHELVHRFLHVLAPGAPPWLNEGLAQYHESMDSAPGHLTLGSTPQRREAERLLYQLPKLPPGAWVRAAPLAEFQGPDGRVANLASRWLVAAAYSDPRLRRSLNAFLRALRAGAAPGPALARAFSPADLVALESAYQAEPARPHPVSYRVRWQPTATPGSPLRVLPPSEGHAFLARLFGSAKPRQARQVLDEAIALDPGNGEAYARRAIVSFTSAEEARADAERAVALAPSSPLAWESLGLALSATPTAGDRPRLGEVARRLAQLEGTPQGLCVRAVVLQALGDGPGAAASADRAATLPGFLPCRRHR